jgi:hypothetical protein
MKDERVPEFKESVRLTSFYYIGIFLVVMSLVYGFNALGTGNQDYINESFAAVIIGVILGLFAFYFGNKKREIRIYEESFTYKAGKSSLEIKIEDIDVLRSERPEGKNMEDMVIFDKNNIEYRITSAYFNREKLIKAFIHLASKLENYEYGEIEDERGWLSENQSSLM